MITSTGYFSTTMCEINNALFNEDIKVEFYNGGKITNYKTSSIEELYNSIIQVFPYNVQRKSDKVEISTKIYDLEYAYRLMDSRNQNLPNEIIDKLKQDFSIEVEEDDKVLPYTLLEDMIYTLVYEYEKVLKRIKKYPVFYGIEDEQIILKNLLILYRNTIKSENSQIEIFPWMILPKNISDMIVKMFIDFIEQRLMVLNPDVSINSSYNINVSEQIEKQIKWLGTQQDLTELFITLVEKGWIPEIGERKRTAFARSILKIFNIEETRKDKKSNLEQSFSQNFKTFNEDGVTKYIFQKDNYKSKFDKIAQNTK